MPEHYPPPELVPWLTDPGSFMRKCRQNGIINSTVRVINEGWRLPAAPERETLGLPFRVSVWTRDVLIGSDNRRWMLARTVIPHHSLTGPERQLIHLKTRPLGAVLFRHPGMQRGPFHFTRLTPADLQRQFHQAIQVASWARHSVFTLDQKPLLLTEVFLPDFVHWLASEAPGSG